MEDGTRASLARWPRVAVLMTGTALLFSLSAIEARAEGTHLFQDLGNGGSSPTSPEAAWKAVAIDFSLLEDDANQAVTLDLFGGASALAAKDRVVKRGDKSYTWFGKLADNPDESVILVVRDGHMSGIIPAPGGPYRVRSLPSGGHRLEQLDHSKFRRDAEPLRPLPAPAVSAPWSPASVTDTAGVIWLLVVYTAAAAAASGDIFADIQLAIDETNAAYVSSLVTTRVSLAHAEEISYTESGVSLTDLSRLSGTTDGYMDNVHSIRTRYHADQVSLIVNALDACGRGYISSGTSSAFTVTALGCATGYYSFGHELGHNQGCEHDRANADPFPPARPLSPAGSYSYSYGYQHPSGTAYNNWRTIMAYNCSPSCTRVQRFSNPYVSYHGDPTGIADPAPDSAENARTINNRASASANWKTGAPIGETHYNVDETDEIGVFRNGTWFLSYSPHDSVGVDLVRSFGSPSPGVDSPEIGEFGCTGSEARPDGISDLVILRKAYSTWMASLSSDSWPGAPSIIRTFGTTAHKRISTKRLDTNGDGCSDIGVFRNGCFAVTESPDYGGVDRAPCLGLSTDEPLAGDLNGDGVSDVGVWRPASPGFYWTYSPDFVGVDLPRTFGAVGDIPFLGEFNGDEKLDLGVYRPATSSFFITYSPDWSGVDLAVVHGVAGDVPILADVNGDGRTDIGVFRPGTARWYVLCYPTYALPACLSQSFGVSGDVPIYGIPAGIP